MGAGKSHNIFPLKSSSCRHRTTDGFVGCVDSAASLASGCIIGYVWLTRSRRQAAPGSNGSRVRLFSIIILSSPAWSNAVCLIRRQQHQSEESKEACAITSRGCHFLFKQRHRQVWDCVLSVIQTVEVLLRTTRSWHLSCGVTAATAAGARAALSLSPRPSQARPGKCSLSVDEGSYGCG